MVLASSTSTSLYELWKIMEVTLKFNLLRFCSPARRVSPTMTKRKKQSEKNERWLYNSHSLSSKESIRYEFLPCESFQYLYVYTTFSNSFFWLYGAWVIIYIGCFLGMCHNSISKYPFFERETWGCLDSKQHWRNLHMHKRLHLLWD